jgi:hypothetical protein
VYHCLCSLYGCFAVLYGLSWMYMFDQCIVYILVFYYDKFYIWRVLDLVWIYRLRNIIQYCWLTVIVWPFWLVFYVYWLKMCRCCRWYRLLLWCDSSYINVLIYGMNKQIKWNEMKKEVLCLNVKYYPRICLHNLSSRGFSWNEREEIIKNT